MRTTFLMLLSTVALLGLAACGGDDTPPPQTTVVAPATTVAPTKGQQLMDLQKAYNDGIISKEEYKEQKGRLLD